MHVSKITPDQMADIWCAIPEEIGRLGHETHGAQHVMKSTHPILGAIIIVDDDDDHMPGSGYVLLSELPIGVLDPCDENGDPIRVTMPLRLRTESGGARRGEPGPQRPET